MDEINGYQRDLVEAVEISLPWKKMSGKNILVTGATGLIGGGIVDVLLAHPDKSIQIFASGRSQKRLEKRFTQYGREERLHFLIYDVTKPFCSDVDFHFMIDAASGANPKEYATNPVGVMKANFEGVDHLLDYGRRHRLQKFVFISSGEIYGEGDGRVFTEDYSGYVNSTSVRSCYPSSKRAAETLCVSYADQYGLDISIVRLSHVYGPYFSENDTRVYAQFIRNVLHGEDIVMRSTGEQCRSWCYVIDCVKAILYVLLKGGKGEAYNVADVTSNISIRQLAEMVAEIGGRKVVVDVPTDEERKGYNPVTKSVFSTGKLESLGWTVIGSMKDKMTSTIQECKRYEVV